VRQADGAFRGWSSAFLPPLATSQFLASSLSTPAADALLSLAATNPGHLISGKSWLRLQLDAEPALLYLSTRSGGPADRAVLPVQRGTDPPIALLVMDLQLTSNSDPSDPMERMLVEVVTDRLWRQLNVGWQRSRARSVGPAATTKERRLLRGLLEAGASMHSALDQDAVLQSIATILAQAGGFEATAIYILDPDTQLLHPAAIVGVESDDAARMRATPVKLSEYAHLMHPSMRISRSYLFDHRRHAMPEGSLLDSALSVPELPPDWRPGQWHPLDSLTIPLELARGQLLGLISLDCPRDRRYPNLATVRALELFSDQCAAAISRTQLYHNMEQLALTDSLTGLNNRHALEQTLSQDLLRIARDHQPYSVLFLDLDRFKDVNDHRGHAVGDQILQQVAAVFRQRLRWLDFAARCGGDEFVILLRDTGTEQAVRVAEDIRRRIAAAPTPCRITASIGVASPAQGNLDATGLLGAADDAMYEAKRSGRDQVSVAGPSALAFVPVGAQPA
jgi:diguanylate cyclase (GGDEF)-like protein